MITNSKKTKKILQHQDFKTTNNFNYDTKWKFCSYWHQINEICECATGNVLEIGIGNKFVYNYLLKMNIKIFSLDIDKNLLPDIVGNVLKLPFKDNSFEVVGCFEVLEHLPFEFFLDSLLELYRVAKNKVIISLPDVSNYFILNVSIPFYGIVRRIFTYNFPLQKKTKICKEHLWEIGLDEYPLFRITNIILKARFSIEKNYRVFENPYHRFFVLKKVEKHLTKSQKNIML